jgi:hypothetical protein
MYLAELQTVCTEYWKRISNLESDKWDLELVEKLKHYEVIGPSTNSFYFKKILFFLKLKKLTQSFKSFYFTFFCLNENQF